MVLESNTLDFLFLNDGERGVPGEKGDDGKTLYTWIKYSQYSDGTNMTDDPTDAIYIGLSYNNESATESNNPSDYKWTKIIFLSYKLYLALLAYLLVFLEIHR